MAVGNWVLSKAFVILTPSWEKTSENFEQKVRYTAEKIVSLEGQARFAATFWGVFEPLFLVRSSPNFIHKEKYISLGFMSKNFAEILTGSRKRGAQSSRFFEFSSAVSAPICQAGWILRADSDSPAKISQIGPLTYKKWPIIAKVVLLEVTWRSAALCMWLSPCSIFAVTFDLEKIST